jgi:S1-C subfamily serine protease
MRKFVSAFLFIFGVTLGLAVAYVSATPSVAEINRANDERMRHSYLSVCKVKSRNGIGSGVLLDTGYILTAAHVVDSDGNGILSPNERKVRVSFNLQSYTARVVYMNRSMDYCVLDSFGAKRDHIDNAATFTIIPPRLAERVYAIGHTNAEPLFLSEGRVTTQMRGAGRSSCYVYQGNSGGPLFNADHEVVGIIFGMGFDVKSDTFTVDIPSDDGMNLVFGSVRRMQPVNGISFYAQNTLVFLDLIQKNLETTIIIPREPTTYEKLSVWFTFGLAKSFVNITLLLGFVFFIRKHLFGS